MLTIPLYIGWELSRTKNAKPAGTPLFRYKPDGNAARENVYRLNVFHLADNTFKFIPVQDGYVAYTGSDGTLIKSSLSYEGFKRILIEYPYLVLLAKESVGGSFKVFAAVMVPTVTDERALKIACLKYIKEINVHATKHTTTKADTQVKKVYTWEDLAFRFRPQTKRPAPPEKRAFDVANARFYAQGAALGGNKARWADITRKQELTKDETKQLIRAVAVAYDIEPTSIKLRFAPRTSNKLGVAHGSFEDFFDAQGHRASVVTLMETSPHVILHEMAHVIAYHRFSRAEGASHGDVFCGVYAHVLDAFCPFTAPHQAAAFMRANGLKVREFDPAVKPSTARTSVRSHRDFELGAAIVVNPRQNRTILRPFVQRIPDVLHSSLRAQ